MLLGFIGILSEIMITAEQICKKLGFRHSMLIPDWDEILFENEWKSNDDKDFDREAIAYYHSNKNEHERRYRPEYEKWRTWSNAEYKLFDHVKHSGTYNVHTGYGYATISINRNKPVADALIEANIWLQYLHEDKLSIFEHSLSANGSYNLVDCRSKPKLELWCHHRQSFPQQFENLEEALVFISKNLWYEDEDKGDEDGYTY